MSINVENFQYLLREMRLGFLDDFQMRCDALEASILMLEKAGEVGDTFNELFRDVHSLKGSGGTHGIGMITSVCHQLEDFLTDSARRHDFGETFSGQGLQYVDLLRRIEPLARQDKPDFSAIEADLEHLRSKMTRSRKAGLIAESSGMMARLYQGALENLPVQLTVVNNGLVALERLIRQPFDFVIAGRELTDLNGISLAAALRLSGSKNAHIPIVLVTSGKSDIAGCSNINAVLHKDQTLPDALASEVRKLVQ